MAGKSHRTAPVPSTTARSFDWAEDPRERRQFETRWRALQAEEARLARASTRTRAKLEAIGTPTALAYPADLTRLDTAGDGTVLDLAVEDLDRHLHCPEAQALRTQLTAVVNAVDRAPERLSQMPPRRAAAAWLVRECGFRPMVNARIGRR